MLCIRPERELKELYEDDIWSLYDDIFYNTEEYIIECKKEDYKDISIEDLNQINQLIKTYGNCFISNICSIFYKLPLTQEEQDILNHYKQLKKIYG